VHPEDASKVASNAIEISIGIFGRTGHDSSKGADDSSTRDLILPLT
jgi:hypothetical protein